MINVEFVPEFPRMISLSNVGVCDGIYDYEATEEECGNLAKRFELRGITSLKAHVVVESLKRQDYRLVVNLHASIIQSCSITTEDMTSSIKQDFSIKLVREAPEDRKEEQDIVFEESGEDIEVMTSDKMDVGELIAQHFSLFIDPYPQKKDAKDRVSKGVILQEGDEQVEEKRPNPFTVLKSLKH